MRQPDENVVKTATVPVGFGRRGLATVPSHFLFQHLITNNEAIYSFLFLFMFILYIHRHKIKKKPTVPRNIIKQKRKESIKLLFVRRLFPLSSFFLLSFNIFNTDGRHAKAFRRGLYQQHFECLS